MYLPAHFEEPRVDVMHELMRQHPLAALVVMTTEGMTANHIPLHLSAEPLPFGILRGHVARANSVWADMLAGSETLAIFKGSESYVSPNWYPTKQEHGKVVPTWNYVAVHAYGELQVIEDPAWLRTHLEALTTTHESALPVPWTMEDAPHDFTERLIKSIVGIEMVITRLSGKWKMSQNQPPQNRAGVVAGLMAQGKDDVAALIKPR